MQELERLQRGWCVCVRAGFVNNVLCVIPSPNVVRQQPRQSHMCAATSRSGRELVSLRRCEAAAPPTCCKRAHKCASRACDGDGAQQGQELETQLCPAVWGNTCCLPKGSKAGNEASQQTGHAVQVLAVATGGEGAHRGQARVSSKSQPTVFSSWTGGGGALEVCCTAAPNCKKIRAGERKSLPSTCTRLLTEPQALTHVHPTGVAQVELLLQDATQPAEAKGAQHASKQTDGHSTSRAQPQGSRGAHGHTTSKRGVLQHSTAQHGREA